MSQQLTRHDQIKAPLFAAQRQIKALLEDDTKAVKFMAAAMVIATEPALNKCSPDSIVQAMVGIAMSNLNVDKNIGHCYLVPYGDKVQLQIGYKGFIQLLFRAGWAVKSYPVYHCDVFNMSFDGWNNKVEFIPDIDARDEGDKTWVIENLRGVYVVARHADTHDEYSAFVSKKVIEKLRLNSPNQRVGNYTKPADKALLDKGLPIGIWADWYVEMAQSKAIKKLAKILPIGDARAATVIASDDKAEMGIQVDYRRTADSGVVMDIEQNEKTVTGTDETGMSVESIIERVKASKTLDELNSNAVFVEKLKADQQKLVRKSWGEKLAELKKPVNEQQKPFDWATAIKECGDADTLTALLDEMPEAAQMEFSQLIDAQYDLLGN